MTPTRLPPIETSRSRDTGLSSNFGDYVQVGPPSPSPAAQIAEWFSVSSTRSAQFIAEKMCQMVCYLWFANGPPASARARRDHSPSHSYSYRRTASSTAALQFSASPQFVSFMQKLLETTQVSQSVIVLSLHYIYRLKERNALTNGQPGSEFRVAVAALMMANKFVDDNTYTNKTWSEVSGILLDDINRMEREFLRGIDFGLYVDKTTYESWLNLLNGLVLAKERESKQWEQSKLRRHPRAQALPHPMPTPHGTSYYGYAASRRVPTPRARSSSPSRPTFRPADVQMGSSGAPAPLHLPPVGSKRSANDAFSPTSATFTLPPLKRPAGVSLEIPSSTSLPKPQSISPTEPLSSFSQLSLTAQSTSTSPAAHATPAKTDAARTLAAPYRMDPSRAQYAPSILHYYSLACSPTDPATDAELPESRGQTYARKTRLRSYQPPQAAAAPPPVPTPYSYAPQIVHSASTSPMHVHMDFASQHHRPNPYPTLPQLPSFGDSAWTQPARSLNSPYAVALGGAGAVDNRSPEQARQSVPSAPFANAGPPGVIFHSPADRPVSSGYQRASPMYAYADYYGRGRRT
ncbi:hypothetical protein PUNSTDRAFT_123340 [Punctularia strigosozonata HHB-11173 SS5]|uniref:uncharacterized protein n=1 Tax=Punctularia strigosozonata (strain HHB-11173) TaxID=741275 RepID=UPI0004416852|nr:uncharacterized protein PUNSTDRAFT_123340 [Punctularia strigosozonata HHB-11173 SS5]EIN13173.1 hypothetical protein PUNSTDRAFT_123340 [Punctularia strigosozonata HHB-11173 SS5]